LRNNSSVSEKVLWSLLRKDQFGVRFHRQYGVGPYTLDFYCPAKKLCIEVDGEQHFRTLVEDKIRDAELGEQGIVVIRVPSLDIFEETGLALTAWRRVIEKALE